jgi:ABC-2 type transport system permease protein
MNASLFQAMLKINAANIMNYALGVVLYQWLVIWIYPSIASNDSVNDLLKSMPENLLKAMGMEGGINQLNDYLANEFYGLIFVLILMVFSVMNAVQLIARLVDRGSMAYLLATPVSRIQIAVTQAAVLVISLVIISAFSIIGGLLGINWFIDDPGNFDRGNFIWMNVVGLALFLVVGAYSFLCSAIIDDEKKALGVATTITVLFYGADMAAKLSEDLSWLKNLTIFTLYKPAEIAKGTFDVWPATLGLTAGALVLFGLAVAMFKKRDLPL